MKAQSFIRKGFFILTALCLSMGVQSCLDDDDNNLSAYSGGYPFSISGDIRSVPS